LRDMQARYPEASPALKAEPMPVLPPAKAPPVSSTAPAAKPEATAPAPPAGAAGNSTPG
jgi:hypothetical protein